MIAADGELRPWPSVEMAGGARRPRTCIVVPDRVSLPPLRFVTYCCARGCAPGALTRLSALTSKPVLYVANVAEGEPLEPPRSWSAAEALGARATAVSARLEAELADMDEAGASAMREGLGVGESRLETVIREDVALST